MATANSKNNKVLVHDLQMAERFLKVLDSCGVFTFQTFDDNKNRKNPALAKVFHGTFQEHQDSLCKLNGMGAGVFVMVNEGDGVRKSERNTCRTNDNVIRVRAIFVDLDGTPIEPVLEAKPPPHLTVESSPGKWHCYWLVTGCPIEKFKQIQISLATKFGGDKKVNDHARVLRLPGFYHQKSTPFQSCIKFQKRRELTC